MTRKADARTVKPRNMEGRWGQGVHRALERAHETFVAGRLTGSASEDTEQDMEVHMSAMPVSLGRGEEDRAVALSGFVNSLDDGLTSDRNVEFASALPDSHMEKEPIRNHAGRAVSMPASGGYTTVVEPLTDREREVLGYLPTHLYQHEIATAMYVSINTVKTYLRCIYRKIGAATRAEAVAIARTNGLL